MEKTLYISGKRSIFSRVFVFMMIVATVAPTVTFQKPLIVSAEEGDSASTTTSDGSSSSNTSTASPSDSSGSDSTTTDDSTTSPVTSSTEETTTITSSSTNEASVASADEVVAETETQAADQNNDSSNSNNRGSGGSGNNAEATVNYGIVMQPAEVIARNVHIQGTASGNFIGAPEHQRVRIDWGDNTVEDASTYQFTRTGAPIMNQVSGTWSSTHTYAAAGTYTVSVYAYNSQNGSYRSASQTQSVVVTGEPDDRLFNYSINMQPAQVTGMDVRIQGTASGAPFVGALQDQKVRISWGDNSSAVDASDTNFEPVNTPINHQMAGPWSSTHTYTTPGTYTITVYVYHQDPNGTQRSTAVTQQVTVGTVTDGVGSIRVCFAIADENGNVATTYTNLPAAGFTLKLRDAVTRNEIASTTTYASNWFTNDTIGGVRVQCAPRIENLPVNGTGYNYDEVTLFNYVHSYWNNPKYNDQFDTRVTSVDSFFDYSDELFDNDDNNNEQRNENSDGLIVLTPDEPNRTLVILNTYDHLITTHCVNGTMTGDEFYNARLTFKSVSQNEYLIDYKILNLVSGQDSPRLPADARVATFEIRNSTDCIAPVSFASYKVFTDTDIRISDQVQVNTTNLVNVGRNETKNLTVNLADCKTQVDAFYGLAPVNFSNPNRSVYTYPNVPFQIRAALTLSDFCDNGGNGGNQAPTITILGDNPFTLIVGTPFNDPGVIAHDDRDSDAFINSRVSSTTNLNINQVGTYTVEYTVTDSGSLTDSKTRVIHVVNAPLACSMPNTLGDTAHENIGDTGQSSLQAILDAGNFSLNAENDQKQYQIWDEHNDDMEAEVEFVNGYTTATGITFGYFLNGDINTFVPLFTAGSNPSYPNKPVFTPGQETSFTVSRNHTLGFAINVEANDGTNHFVTSKNELNFENKDQMLAFNSGSGYILAFEDSSLDHPNTDYNDMVVRFTITDCDTGGGGGNNHPPVITLLGANPFTLRVGETFTEPGATAFDEEDHDITGRIASSTNLNTEAPGTYTKTYEVQDNAGAIDTKTRTIIVSERNGGGGGNHAPVITLNGDNPMTITVGHDYNEPGATAHDPDPEDGDLTDEIVITGTVDTEHVGTYTIIYTVTDSHDLSDTKTRTVNVVRDNDGNNGGGGGGGGGRRRPTGQVLGEQIGPCIYLTQYLRRDWDNDPAEVLKLQYFLKYSQGYANVPTNGVFDDATFAAVSAFQERYFNDILAPWGYTGPTGFVYITTSKKINEIICNTEFPLTPYQTLEILQFRQYLEGLRASGALTTTPAGVPGVQATDSYRTSDNSEMSFSPTTSTSSPLVSLSDDGNTPINMANIQAIAASIFSIPKDRGILLQSLYFFLIAVIAIYLFTEIIVGSRDMSYMTKHQIWARKSISYTIGLILAIIAALWYQIFSIVLPLAILAIVSAGFFIWAVTRKTPPEVETTTVIELPPSTQNPH